MQKKKIIIFTLIFFLSNCGFTPIYLDNNKSIFSIEQVNYEGDRELNNFLKLNLNRYKDVNNDNKIFIEANTKYEKIVLSKDGTGKATSYQLIAEVVFLVKPNNKKILIAISPVIPHFSHECMEILQINEKLLWPKVDEKTLLHDNIKFVIQFNGRTRQIMETKKNNDEQTLLAEIKKDTKLKKYLENKKIIKKIFIPNKLINILTN